jgi:hypothetical protein
MIINLSNNSPMQILGDESDEPVNPFAEYFHMLSERNGLPGENIN